MISKRFLLFTVLFGSSLHTFDMNEHQYQAIQNISISSSIIGAIAVGSYIAYNYNIPENFYVKNSHPYAQVWYDEMAIKYPQAHLQNKAFLSQRRGIFTNDVSWESGYNTIYAHAGDLTFLHTIYRKKSQDLEISETEQLFLHICEFLLLHEAAHVNNQDSIKNVMINFPLIIIGEVASAACKSSQIYNPFIHNDLFGRKHYLSDYLAAFLACIGLVKYMRHIETQADQFAYENAKNIEILQAAKKFFEHIDIIALAAKNEENEDYELAQYIIAHPTLRRCIDFIIDPLHPSPCDRIAAVDKEIDRRLTTK
ncbi:MAG: M48 family metalloprotease [Candidatus Chromulinivorax sp.]